MQKYNIFYSQDSYEDLRNIYHYISLEIQMDDYAKSIIKNIMNKIKTLSTLPERCKILYEEPWKSRKIRILVIKHYNVYFHINEQINEIEIIRIIHNGRNLKQIIKLDD